MCQGSKITGFDQEFNNSKEIIDALQNIILQHTDICTFVWHYEVDININIQGIICKTGSQILLLSTQESKSLNKLLVVLAWQDKLQEKQEVLMEQTIEAKQRYNIALHELNKQPIINLEQQLAGKLVITKIIDTLEHKGSMAPQYLMVINTMLTMLDTILEAEY
ncbi:hypothetical protein BDW59DRAFT_176957 [Aspergillus cavernicola]|uniref:Uncharacterized protein n=1 Tax=Aspergillus cavernicola TaxID=176166 RepID=A0ABR4HAU5_9EURO